MSSALMVVGHRQYPDTQLYDRCPTSPVSNWFDVPAGHHAVVKLYSLPTDWCVVFEEGICLCCCDIEWFPIEDDCLCGGLKALSMFKCRELCLGPGQYRAMLEDEDGEPVTPAIKEAILKVSIQPGPCP